MLSTVTLMLTFAIPAIPIWYRQEEERIHLPLKPADSPNRHQSGEENLQWHSIQSKIVIKTIKTISRFVFSHHLDFHIGKYVTKTIILCFIFNSSSLQTYFQYFLSFFLRIISKFFIIFPIRQKWKCGSWMLKDIFIQNQFACRESEVE